MSALRQKELNGKKHACKLRCEGIVSKRLGRATHWLMIKNPAAPAVTPEVEEDWGG